VRTDATRNAPTRACEARSRRPASATTSVSASYGCAVPPVAALIARAVGRSLGLSGRAILLGLGREAQRQYRGRPEAPLDSAPAAPIPRDALVRAAYVAWLCGLVAFVLVVLNVHLFLPSGRTVAWFQLAVGAILVVEGLGLVVQRFPFRRLLGARLAARSQRRRGRPRRAGLPRLVGAVLTAVGILWLAAGAYNVLRGALALV
jgi:hypothetical protein